MQKRKFDELISHFNRKVSDMSIDQKYKMELLGMISTIGFAHKKELSTNLAEVGTDCISRQAAIEAIAKMMPQSLTPDGSHPADKEIFIAQEAFADCIKTIEILPSSQPETAKRIVGKSRDGMTLWYQCDMCNEPVDEQDNYCRGCGRRLIDETD